MLNCTVWGYISSEPVLAPAPAQSRSRHHWFMEDLAYGFSHVRVSLLGWKRWGEFHPLGAVGVVRAGVCSRVSIHEMIMISPYNNI